MPNYEKSFNLNKLSNLILDQIPFSITIIDLEGKVMFFNEYGTKILDRKPGYIGDDVRNRHSRQESIVKIENMINEFKNGREEKFCFEVIRDGKCLIVQVLPFKEDNILIGCLHCVYVKQ